MRTPELDRRVQAKTGTIANVRALSGFLDASAAATELAFSMIANNFTAPSAQSTRHGTALERLAAAR